MMLGWVRDGVWSSLQKEMFDVAVFASGYEIRATHVPRQLCREQVRNVLILGFEEGKTHPQRIANDAYYAACWSEADYQVVSANDDDPIFRYLQSLSIDKHCRLRILVDYSAMSRPWYSAILNWARMARHNEETVIELVYNVGDHRVGVPEILITDILSIPGCEGFSVSTRKTLAVFGLGFDENAPLCVLDRVQADTVYAYYADPAPFQDYPEITRRKNRHLLEAAKVIIPLPIFSVETTYRYLAEVVAPHRGESNVIFIPMGPKPHVLAAILLSMRFQDICCLRVSGMRKEKQTVGATAEVVSTTVCFSPEIPGGRLGMPGICRP